MDMPKKMDLPTKLFFAFLAVLVFLGGLTCLGLLLAIFSSEPSDAGKYIKEYLAYIVGFAAITFGNAAGGIIANHYSNK